MRRTLSRDRAGAAGGLGSRGLRHPVRWIGSGDEPHEATRGTVPGDDDGSGHPAMERERPGVEPKLAALPRRAVTLRARRLEDRLDIALEVDPLGSVRRPRRRRREEGGRDEHHHGQRRLSNGRTDSYLHGADGGCKAIATEPVDGTPAMHGRILSWSSRVLSIWWAPGALDRGRDCGRANAVLAVCGTIAGASQENLDPASGVGDRRAPAPMPIPAEKGGKSIAKRSRTGVRSFMADPLRDSRGPPELGLYHVPMITVPMITGNAAPMLERAHGIG